MVHTLATPARSLTNVIWLDTVAPPAPVVNVQDCGAGEAAAVRPEIAGRQLHLERRGRGQCRRWREAQHAPGSVVGDRIAGEPRRPRACPATPGVMVSASPSTDSGSMGRSKTTAMGDIGEMPSTSSAGTRVSIATPGAMVRKPTVTGSPSATPATSAALPPTCSSYSRSGAQGLGGRISSSSPLQRSSWRMRARTAGPLDRRGVHQRREADAQRRIGGDVGGTVDRVRLDHRGTLRRSERERRRKLRHLVAGPVPDALVDRDRVLRLERQRLVRREDQGAAAPAGGALDVRLDGQRRGRRLRPPAR